MGARINVRLLHAERSWNIRALQSKSPDKRSLKLPNRSIWAGNSVGLRASLKRSDCAYIQRYPRCNQANCQLLLPFRQRCRKIKWLYKVCMLIIVQNKFKTVLE